MSDLELIPLTLYWRQQVCAGKLEENAGKKTTTSITGIIVFICTSVNKSRLDLGHCTERLWSLASSPPTNQLGALKQGRARDHFIALYGTICWFQRLSVAECQNFNIKVRPTSHTFWRTIVPHIKAFGFDGGIVIRLRWNAASILPSEYLWFAAFTQKNTIPVERPPWTYLIVCVAPPAPQDVSCSGQSQWAIQQNFLFWTDHMYRLDKQTAGARPHHMILPPFSVSVDQNTLLDMLKEDWATIKAGQPAWTVQICRD